MVGVDELSFLVIVGAAALAALITTALAPRVAVPVVVTEAARRPLPSTPPSPKKSPGASSATVSPSRCTRAAPSTITKTS